MLRWRCGRRSFEEQLTAIDIGIKKAHLSLYAQVAKLVDARDLKFWAPSLETAGVNGVKFGETSTHNGGGNPERSPNYWERVETWRHPPNLWDFRSTVKRKSRPQMPYMAAAKAVVGTKIPRLNGRAGSIPALGTIWSFQDVL